MYHYGDGACQTQKNEWYGQFCIDMDCDMIHW